MILILPDSNSEILIVLASCNLNEYVKNLPGRHKEFLPCNALYSCITESANSAGFGDSRAIEELMGLTQ